MYQEQRLEKILTLLEERGKLSVKEMVDELEVFHLYLWLKNVLGAELQLQVVALIVNILQQNGILY